MNSRLKEIMKRQNRIASGLSQMDHFASASLLVTLMTIVIDLGKLLISLWKYPSHLVAFVESNRRVF